MKILVTKLDKDKNGSQLSTLCQLTWYELNMNYVASDIRCHKSMALYLAYAL